jgi:hypothetical protein
MTRLLKLAPVFAILLVVAAPLSADQIRSNDAGVSWSLKYDHTTHLVTFAVDGTASEYTTPVAGYSQIYVRAYTSDSFGESGIRVDNVGFARDVLVDEFTVTADRTMSWSGKIPGQSSRAIRIEVGPMMPAYTFDDVTWGELKDLFNSSK